MATPVPAAAAARTQLPVTEAKEKNEGSLLSRIFHRHVTNQSEKDKIVQILKDNLPPLLRESILSDKHLLADNGELNPVFYAEVLESMPDTQIVSLGNGISVIEQPDSKFKTVEGHIHVKITEVKIEGFKPWEVLHKKYPSIQDADFVPAQVAHVITLKFHSHGNQTLHFFKGDRVADATKECLEAYFEMKDELKFSEKYDNETNVNGSDAKKFNQELWQLKRAKELNYQKAHHLNDYDPDNNPYSLNIRYPTDFKEAVIDKAASVRFIYRTAENVQDAVKKIVGV